MDIFERLKHLKESYIRENSDKVAYEEQMKKQKEEVKTLEKFREKTMTMKALLEKASEKAREDGKKVLSETTSNAIQMVMDNEYKVGMETTIKRGVPHVDLVITKQAENGIVIDTDPANEEGGGISDVVAMSSFISLGMLVNDKNRAPVFFDEPAKYLFHKNKSENMAKFLKEMVSYSNRQIFYITHDPVIASAGDRVYEVEMDKNCTSHIKDATDLY